MYIKISSLGMMAILCISIVGCTAPKKDFVRLTHTASLKNIGSEEIVDAVLFFGESRYKMGILPSGIAKHISRSGEIIPTYASAEWRRADGSMYSGKVRIEKPKEMASKERYIIQIGDDNDVSLSVEVPRPISGIEKQL